jgi:hypothetical protein
MTVGLHYYLGFHSVQYSPRFFLKQLAFELHELLLLSAFPELDGTVRWREDKRQFCAQFLTAPMSSGCKMLSS